MQLLLFSEVHCDDAACRSLVERAAAVDAVLAAGDFATCRRGLNKTIAALTAIERPTVLVAGNAETTDELCHACRDWPAAHVLHGSSVTIDGITFFGLGGAVPVTPFGDWSYDLTEEEAADLLADCPAGCVLVTHSPPKGAVDQDSQGRSLGSTAVRDTLERARPILAVCGHIHASAGKVVQIGPTPVVNAGPQGIIRDLQRL